MRFIEVNEYSEQQFMRLTGVKRGVFEMMIEVVSQSQRTFGRPRKLSVEDNESQEKLHLHQNRECRLVDRQSTPIGAAVPVAFDWYCQLLGSAIGSRVGCWQTVSQG